MIEIIKEYKNNYKKGHNQMTHPGPESNKVKFSKENIQNSIIDNSNPYFNFLFFEDFQSSQLKYEEETENKKNSEDINLYKYNPLNNLKMNKIKYKDDNLEFEFNKNLENELNFVNLSNSNSFPNIEPNTINNLNQNMNANVNKSLQKNKNLNLEINENNKSFPKQNLKLNKKVFSKMLSNKLQRSHDKSKNKFEINQKIKSTKMIYKNHFAKFIAEYGNTLIEKSKLPNKFKKYKLYCPHKSFIHTTKNKENKKFLLFTLQDIFCYKKKRLKNKLQNKNKILINDILNYINGDEDKENYEKIKSFFYMKLEDAYKFFEDSLLFENYISNQKIILHDRQLKETIGFSILEKESFIKMINED